MLWTGGGCEERGTEETDLRVMKLDFGLSGGVIGLIYWSLQFVLCQPAEGLFMRQLLVSWTEMLNDMIDNVRFERTHFGLEFLKQVRQLENIYFSG